jgi:hypothetical protein
LACAVSCFPPIIYGGWFGLVWFGLAWLAIGFGFDLPTHTCPLGIGSSVHDFFFVLLSGRFFFFFFSFGRPSRDFASFYRPTLAFILTLATFLACSGEVGLLCIT